MNLRLPCLVYLLLFSFLNASAEEKSTARFGKVTAEDFRVIAPTDSAADAIVIADIGSSTFEGNNKGGFLLVFKRYRRVKIVTRNGFDAATVSIPLYSSGRAEERIENLKARTYNLENGNVNEADLDKASIFTDKLSEHMSVRKFTFPAVKAGSIIEYTYTVNSDFLFNLQPWTFQGRYPCLWSEYTASIPQYFEYVINRQGYLPYAINTSETRNTIFTITQTENAGPSSMFDLRANVVKAHWAIRNAPAMKEEKFMASNANYLAQISFQLAAYNWPDQPRKAVISTWPEAVTRLLQSEYFGDGLGDRNDWLNEPLEKILAGKLTLLEKTQHIYAYVRDNFACTRHTALYRDRSLKDVFEKRSGNVAELNLLLTAMLRHADLPADPLILSTRSNGTAIVTYPLLDNYNYVVCHMLIGGRHYYMDASRADLGFGRLPADCYNGYARVINNTSPLAINLSADSLQETKITGVILIPDEKDSTKLSGTYSSQPGYYESLAVRQAVKDAKEAEFFKKARTNYSMDVDISHPVIMQLAEKESPVKISYTFTFDKPEGNLLYINPMMSEGMHENFFSAATRLYPVEMPYDIVDLYNFDMAIPPGYLVEELPVSYKVSLNEKEGTFNYLVGVDAGHIRISSQLIMRKAIFGPEDYEDLRSFFAIVVKKHAEQIVLKKKS